MKSLFAPACALLLAAACAGSATAALTPEDDKKILDGLDMMYALQLDSAAANFKEVMLAEPDEPAGPFFLGGLYWIQFSQSFDVLEGSEKLEEQFLFYTDEALHRCDRLIKKNPQDGQAYFYMGGVWGFRGWWKVLQRHWLRAARLGLKGYRYLEKAVKIDPDIHDAYLGLGVYDYYAATMPTVLRILSSLVLKGDKERGMHYIQITINDGHFSKTEAKIFLLGIYNTMEKRYDKALELIRELRAAKPENLYFGLLEITAMMHLKDYAGAAREGDKILLDVIHNPSPYLQLSLFYVYVGEAYQGTGDHERAIDYFTRGIQVAPDPTRAAVTYCYMRRAQSYDVLGRRLEAVKDYKVVLSRKDYFDSDIKSREGLQKPVTQDNLLKQLEE